MPGFRRPLVRVCFTLAPLLAAGCATTSGPSLYSARQVPYPDYARAEALRGLSRSTICHAGRTITIVDIAVEEHMKHGDYFGDCSAENQRRHERYYDSVAPSE